MVSSVRSPTDMLHGRRIVGAAGVRGLRAGFRGVALPNFVAQEDWRSGQVAGVTEPDTGLAFYELSHPWGYGTPVWPGDADIGIRKAVSHAKHGVLSRHLTLNMHCSTHLNAPIHLVAGAAYVAQVPVDRFFGNGVVLSIPKSKWGVVTADDLEAATPQVRRDDIVLINTGWHRKYADSQEYFGHAPGLALAAAKWLTDRGVRLVGIDTAAVDHPLATSLGGHRNGPLMKHLPTEYERETGRSPLTDFPDWNPAHRHLLTSGVCTIENVGGDIDAVTGVRCTIHACPWRWKDGEACIIRLMAILDGTGRYRVEPGS